MKYVLLFGIFSIFLSGNSLAMDAAKQEDHLVVILESGNPHPHKLPFSEGFKREVIPLTPQTLVFASANLQLRDLATFMLGKADRKNKILYAANEEVLFALYYVAKNPTHFDAVVLQNSEFHENEFSSLETFFRDIPTLEKCEQIRNDIPVIFAGEDSNDKMIHAALRIAGKNAHFFIPGCVLDNAASIYSLTGKNRTPQELDETAVSALLHRKEKERIHRYKEYGWWAGIFLLVSFLSHKSGLLEKIVGKFSFNK